MGSQKSQEQPSDSSKCRMNWSLEDEKALLTILENTESYIQNGRLEEFVEAWNNNDPRQLTFVTIKNKLGDQHFYIFTMERLTHLLGLYTDLY